MAQLDVSEILLDPDFTDSLVCARNTQTVDDDGIATDATVSTPFVGVVTNDLGDILKRFPEGSYVTGSIMVHSRFPLTAGRDGIDADRVQWKGDMYTVFNIANWTTYGAGFTAALCTPVKLSGGANA
jgi:galactose-6-phosphate isomerase